jgi:hypothetical protein
MWWSLLTLDVVSELNDEYKVLIIVLWPPQLFQPPQHVDDMYSSDAAEDR